jgi:hypothetical protein
MQKEGVQRWADLVDIFLHDGVRVKKCTAGGEGVNANLE